MPCATPCLHHNAVDDLTITDAASRRWGAWWLSNSVPYIATEVDGSAGQTALVPVKWGVAALVNVRWKATSPTWRTPRQRTPLLAAGGIWKRSHGLQ